MSETNYIRKLLTSIDTVLIGLRTTFPYLVGTATRFREATEEYPDKVSARMPEDLPARFRGFLNNDINRCSGCRYCVEACPVDCIQIETEPGPQNNVSWVAVFDVDHSKCMFCGLCVDVCPPKSLTHTNEYQGSSFKLIDMVASFGRGFATAEMRKKWLEEQKRKDSQAEQSLLFDSSPIGAELKRMKQNKERENKK